MFPQSLILAKDERFDVALEPRAVLLKNKPEPKFRIDWKDDSGVREKFGWHEPDRELRVRTAIDPDRRRAAESQLFAHQMVSPQGCRWVSSIGLSSVPEADRKALLGAGRSRTFSPKGQGDSTLTQSGEAPASLGLLALAFRDLIEGDEHRRGGQYSRIRASDRIDLLPWVADA